eukprot:GDKJ01017774.1.p1 GENE.GDKJ01017774.1~~GDKJ01017774.1.p1  ORF type:complete len:320 (-),score=58.81 GDKJ01017774.1:237-1196(-)
MSWLAAVTQMFGGNDEEDDEGTVFMSEVTDRISEASEPEIPPLDEEDQVSVPNYPLEKEEFSENPSLSIPLPEGPAPDFALVASHLASTRRSELTFEASESVSPNDFLPKMPSDVVIRDYSTHQMDYKTNFASAYTTRREVEPISLERPVNEEELALEALSDISDLDISPRDFRVLEEMRATERHLNLIASRIRVVDSEDEESYLFDSVIDIRKNTAQRMMNDVVQKGPNTFERRPVYAKYLSGRTKNDFEGEVGLSKEVKEMKEIFVDKMPSRISAVMKNCRWEGDHHHSIEGESKLKIVAPEATVYGNGDMKKGGPS